MSPEQIQIVRTVVNEFLPVAKNQTCAEKVFKIVLKFVEGDANQATTRCEVRDVFAEIGEQSNDEKLNLCIKTASALARGYFHWMQGQESADMLDIYPALQLYDCYQHPEPVDWVQKWRDNGGRVFARNEMIALKNDPIWIRISAFKLPFPPFDLGGGMDVSEVGRKEAQELGLISPSQRVEPIVADLDFAAALQQRLKEYFSPEVQGQKMEIAMRQASAGVLLQLAQERLDSLEEITSESAPEIIMILERALERGFGEESRQQLTACGLLVDIFDSIEEFEKANFYREKQLEPLKVLIAKSSPTDWSMLTYFYGLAAGICEKLDQRDQAVIYRQLELENRDGFMLLRDILDELKACGGNIEKEIGAKILDELTKAAERLPEKYQRQHAEIYRATGEVLEAWGDTTQAIEYYEFAIQKNPKVGVKKRLDTLRKNESA